MEKVQYLVTQTVISKLYHNDSIHEGATGDEHDVVPQEGDVDPNIITWQEKELLYDAMEQDHSQLFQYVKVMVNDMCINGLEEYNVKHEGVDPKVCILKPPIGLHYVGFNELKHITFISVWIHEPFSG